MGKNKVSWTPPNSREQQVFVVDINHNKIQCKNHNLGWTVALKCREAHPYKINLVLLTNLGLLSSFSKGDHVTDYKDDQRLPLARRQKK
jgi:hypothetical protein